MSLFGKKRQLILPTGSLEISARWTQGMDDIKRIYERLQVPFEVLKRDELRQRWPQINADDIEVALYEPGTSIIAVTRTWRVSDMPRDSTRCRRLFSWSSALTPNRQELG